MDLKEILEKFKINENGQIDESIQEEIENYISEVVDLKASEKAKTIVKEITEPIIEEAKETLVNEYEEKFEEYKDMITSKFSDFIDSVLDEEMQIPENVLEYARKGELYSDLIDQLKIRVGIDEGALDEEAKELLKEARDEIVKLRDSLNEKEGASLDLKEDARQMAAELYIRKKCDGLTESQKNKALPLLQGIMSKEKIDERFDIICENLFENKMNDNESTNKKNIKETVCVCPECGRETSITEGSCSLYKCPDCEDVKLTEKDCSKDEEKSKSKTNENVSKKSGFGALLESYVEIMKSNKW